MSALGRASALDRRLWHLLPQPVPAEMTVLLEVIEAAPDRAAADRAVTVAAAASVPVALIQRAYRTWLGSQAYRVPA